MPTRIFKLPPKFVWDCIECDCDVGNVVRHTKTYVLLECSDEQLDELRSRADYYASEAKYMGCDGEYRSLGKSAERVLELTA